MKSRYSNPQSTLIKLTIHNSICVDIITYREVTAWSRHFPYGKCSKNFYTFLYLFSNKLFIIRAGIHKMLLRTANREDPDQTASSDLSLHCLSQPFWQATSLQNFRISTDILKCFYFAELKLRIILIYR